MNDRDLKSLLSGLTHEKASAGFKTRVIARLDETASSPRHSLGWALAAAVLVAALGSALLWGRVVEQREQEVARIQSLRTEYRDLEDELRDLRRLFAATEPVVAVEGSGEYDYVVDLQEIARASAGNAFPVSYRLPE